MWRAKPSMKSYWLRCASSAMTTMLRRSESTGCRSPLSSGKNFWIVVKTTPPAATLSFARRSARLVGLHRRLAQQLVAARERAEELIVEVVAVGQHDERRVLHRRIAGSPARRRTPSSGSCPSPACARPRRRAGRPALPPGCFADLVAARGLMPLCRPRRACAPHAASLRTATFTAWNWW